MAHSVSFDEAHSIVQICYTGRIEAASIRLGAADAFKVVAEHACPRVLIDCREGTLVMSTVDIYHLPKMVAETVSGMGLNVHSLKRAIVISDTPDDYAFVETVFHNQMQNMTVFHDLEAARNWLLEKKGEGE